MYLEEIIRLWAFTIFRRTHWTAEFDEIKTEGKTEEEALSNLVDRLKERE